ncbi:hypothetical protein PM082_006601 [Marasmius tenuissimus]|nr:hypothetical protein PM082_006601 [Marasmius tenuissimus]
MEKYPKLDLFCPSVLPLSGRHSSQPNTLTIVWYPVCSVPANFLYSMVALSLAFVLMQETCNDGLTQFKVNKTRVRA